VIFRVGTLAAEEVKEAARRYGEVRPELGDDFLHAIEQAYHDIERDPHRFARMESRRAIGDVRRILLWRFPYIVIYEVTETAIEVLAVAHTSRRPGYWLKRRHKP